MEDTDKMKDLKLSYRRLRRYILYYDAPKIHKVIVISLKAERKFFNIFYYARTKIRSYFINRVYKKHGDHHFV